MRFRIAIGMVTLAACGGAGTVAPPPPPPNPPPPPPAPVATVTVSPDNVTLVPQETRTLTATLKDASGNTLTGRSIVWNTGSGTVASVDAGGIVTGAGAGSTGITATSEGRTGTSAITVRDGAVIGASGGVANGAGGNAVITVPASALGANTAISITPVQNPTPHPNLVPGTAYDFGPDGTAFAQPVTIAIRYDQAQVGARIPANFRIHKWSGTAWVPVAGSTVNVATRTVTATTSSFSQYAIAQLPPVAQVIISPNPVDLPLGMEIQLAVTHKDAQGNVLTGRETVWGSSASGTASVSQAGLVQSHALGDAIITATSETVPGQLNLKVRQDPSDRTLAPSQQGAFLMINGIITLFLTAPPHVCAIGADQRGHCWGRNNAGQLGDGTILDRAVATPIALANSLVAITTGGEFSCALDTSQNAWCWGVNFNGVFGNGTTTPSSTPVPAGSGKKFVDLAAGYLHVCGIDTNGATWCWGDNRGALLGIGNLSPAFATVPTRVNPDPGFVRLSSGGSGTCGLTAQGAVHCWGTAGTSFRFIAPPLGPTLISTSPAFTRISVGQLHACGLTMDRRAFCFGDNLFGQLGDGTTNVRTVPTLVGGGKNWRFISAGDFWTCGITTENAALCWGSNSEGMLGNGTTDEAHLPVAVNGTGTPPFAVIAAGDQETCGLTVVGVGYCWGHRGTLADGDYGYAETPVQVLGATNATDLALHRPFGCYVNANKQLRCWAETEDRTSAQVPTFGNRAAKAVSGAYLTGCIIVDPAATISCWGFGYRGQLGTGSTADQAAPTPIVSNRTFSSVANGTWGACGISTAQELFCWGNDQLIPTQVMVGTTFTQVAGGDFGGACALAVSGIAYCGEFPNLTTAILPPPGKTWSMMAHGRSSFGLPLRCGLVTTGEAYCMGENNLGQVGDGTTTNRTSMVPVAGGLRFTQIVGGADTFCGITMAQDAYCWGDGYDGHLGSAPALLFSTMPVLVPGGRKYLKLAVGNGNACGIVVGGTIYCWGSRRESALGDGERDDRLSPFPMAGSPRFLLYEPGTASLMAVRESVKLWARSGPKLDESLRGPRLTREDLLGERRALRIPPRPENGLSPHRAIPRIPW